MNSFLENRQSFSANTKSQTHHNAAFAATDELDSDDDSLEKSQVPTHTHDSNPPKIELIKKDGVVKKIVITCPCGKCTELECSF